MNTAEDFVNWLEGFLDACKDAPTTRQIKEVRKKISAVYQSTDELYNSLWDPSMAPQSTKAFSTITLVQAQKEAVKKQVIQERSNPSKDGIIGGQTPTIDNRSDDEKFLNGLFSGQIDVNKIRQEMA